MTLSHFDLAELDRLAASLADGGKRPACWAYTQYGLAQGWHGSPDWLEGRDAFMRLYKRHRAAYLASVVAMQLRWAETAPAGFCEGERA
jgi:hypothetical protein